MSRGRVVLGVGAIGATALLLSGCNGFRVESKSFNDDFSVTQAVKAVRFDNGSGRVRIGVGSQGLVKRTVFYSGDRPGPTSRVEGDTLVLDNCPQRSCSIDYDVTLPAGAKIMGEVGSGDVDITAMAEVSVKSGSGDIRVRDVPGPVTVKGSSGRIELADLGQTAVVAASSGDVTLTTVKGDVTVQSSSGQVTGSGLGGRTSVECSSGDVSLTLAGTHPVKVVATSGNVRVKVPQGQPYRVNVQTTSGECNIGIATDPAAGTGMDLQASSGDVTVSYA
jgi:hypothetical protein